MVKEICLLKHDLDEDYLKLTLQYAYITMFIVIFPIGPLLALINNIFDFSIDLRKLNGFRRERPIDRLVAYLLDNFALID